MGIAMTFVAVQYLGIVLCLTFTCFWEGKVYGAHISSESKDQEDKEETDATGSPESSSQEDKKDQFRKQIEDEHSKHRPREIQYNVLKHFGRQKNEARQFQEKSGIGEEKQSENSENLQEIDFETIKKFQPGSHKLSKQDKNEDKDYDEVKSEPENKFTPQTTQGNPDQVGEDYKNENEMRPDSNEDINDNEQGVEENRNVKEEIKNGETRMMMEEHLERKATDDNGAEGVNELPVKVLKHLEAYEEQE